MWFNQQKLRSLRARLILKNKSQNTSSEQNDTDSTQNTASAQTGSSAQNATPSDAQIAAIVVAANNVDINAGKLAEKMSNNQEVKDFAKHMEADHSAVNQQATALVKKLRVTPEESETSQSLTNDGKENISNLKGQKGAEFDRAYVDNEVAYHQAVIDAMNQTLIPNAQNAELKETLVKVKSLFEAHLAHAKQLQASLR